MRACSKCGEAKPPTEFYKKSDARSGLRAQCKVCVDARNKFRYDNILSKDKTFMDRNRARGMQWYWENRDHCAARIAKTHREQRLQCINHYGPKCACCGESTYEFLSIDHVNGGGNKHREATAGNKITRWLIRNKFPDGFRVLCHNCNQAIGFHGHCPHQINPQKAAGTPVP